MSSGIINLIFLRKPWHIRELIACDNCTFCIQWKKNPFFGSLVFEDIYPWFESPERVGGGVVHTYALWPSNNGFLRFICIVRYVWRSN